MIHAGQHISIFGMTGCGKTTLTREIASLYKRKIIFDRLGEWNDISGAIFVSDFEQFALEYRELHLLHEFIIVVQPTAGTSSEGLTALTDQILALVYQVEAHDGQGLGIIFEEVWLYAPLHSTPPWFLETLLTGRHHNLSIIGNSQRPANVSKTMVTQSRHVFVGQFFEMNDRKYYRDCFGDKPWLENPPPKYQFYWYQPDTDTHDKTQLIQVTP